MWSAGICLYVMLIGTVPFRAGNMEDLHSAIKKGVYDLQEEKISSRVSSQTLGGEPASKDAIASRRSFLVLGMESIPKNTRYLSRKYFMVGGRWVPRFMAT